MVETPSDPVCMAVLQRALLAGHRCFVPQSVFSQAQATLSAEWSDLANRIATSDYAPKGAVVISSKPPNEEIADALQGRFCQIIIGEAEGTSATNRHTVVVVSDLLPPYGEDLEMFRRWLNEGAPHQEHPENRAAAHWCGMNDVASALTAALPYLTDHAHRFDVCGRRRWSMEATKSEFCLLATRALAGRSGEFTAEMLQPQPPPLDVETLDGTNPSKRPAIETFHRFLKEHTGEGWRPTTPVRQLLMLVVAQLTS